MWDTKDVCGHRSPICGRKGESSGKPVRVPDFERVHCGEVRRRVLAPTTTTPRRELTSAISESLPRF